MDKTRAELDLTRAELNARPYVELLQRKVMPTWLFNDEDLTNECKWEISLEFCLSQAAQIILYRLDEKKLEVEIHCVAKTLSDAWDIFSEIYSHKKNPINRQKMGGILEQSSDNRHNCAGGL